MGHACARKDRSPGTISGLNRGRHKPCDQTHISQTHLLRSAMNNRRVSIGILVAYWVLLPAGVFYFLVNRLGYPTAIGGLFAGIVFAVPLLALPSVLRKPATASP